MSYPTFGDIREEVELELDLESEDFISQTDMIDYFNEAVRECEASIHKLGIEDLYFKRRAFLPLVSGENEVQMPDDIYAFKIIRIIYAGPGNKTYTIKKMRKDIHYEDMEDLRVNNTSSDWYEYEILNNVVDEDGGPVIYLTPASRETSTENVVIFYIRKANRCVDDNSICDIPAFESFIKKYAIWKCYKKEGHPNTGDALQDLNGERELMIETLTNMVPDNDSVIEKDMSGYDEMN